jgi:hypothetical protein
MKKNWKTTTIGALIILCGVASKVLPMYSEILTPVAVALTGLLGLVSHDANNPTPNA